jgi:hypothetical protein
MARQQAMLGSLVFHLPLVLQIEDSTKAQTAEEALELGVASSSYAIADL